MTYGLWLLAICAGTMRRPSGDWRYPINMDGEACPYPIEPMLYVGQAIGMFHCSYCGEMQVAGMPHTDWSCTTAGCVLVIEAEVHVTDDPDNEAWHPYCRECVGIFEAAGYEIRHEF